MLVQHGKQLPDSARDSAIWWQVSKSDSGRGASRSLDHVAIFLAVFQRDEVSHLRFMSFELAGPSTSVQAATMATEKRRFLDATVDESDAFIRKPSAVRATHFESGRMDTRWTIRDCIPAAIYRFGYCAVLQYPEVLMKHSWNPSMNVSH